MEMTDMSCRNDSEPWRCCKTDGKKWRCPRNVIPGDRCCERHISKSRGMSCLKDSEPLRCCITDGKRWRCPRNVIPGDRRCERHMSKSRGWSREHVNASQNNPNENTADVNISSDDIAVNDNAGFNKDMVDNHNMNKSTSGGSNCKINGSDMTQKRKLDSAILSILEKTAEKEGADTAHRLEALKKLRVSTTELVRRSSAQEPNLVVELKTTQETTHRVEQLENELKTLADKADSDKRKLGEAQDELVREVARREAAEKAWKDPKAEQVVDLKQSLYEEFTMGFFSGYQYLKNRASSDHPEWDLSGYDPKMFSLLGRDA